MNPNIALGLLLAVLLALGALAAWRVFQGLVRVGALLILIVIVGGAAWWLL